MSPERWQQVEELFNAALEREPDQRPEFLDGACAHDQSLRNEVESLLHSQTQAGGLIEEAIRDAADHAAEDQASQLPERIGPYKVLRQLGRGGMGAVYLAVRDDDQFKKRVAIKLIRRGMDTEDILRRFRNERQILASLEHPNIARLFDGGTSEDGLSYFVMEYVEGKPLIDYSDTHKLTTVERLRMFREVCSAVHYAHQNLVVHRDLKPGNIMVTSEGVPKLLDFGIAKLLNPELSSQTIAPTGTAIRLMTPEYASPEQVRGDSITTASDVYSLGVLLYELLSGHRPYRVKNSTPQEIIRVVCEQEPEKPSTIISHTEEVLGPDGTLQTTLTPETVSRTREGEPEKLRRQLTGDLDNIVLMAMRKEPQRRYASVEQFSEDLRRHLDGLPVIARQDTFAYRAEKFIKRNKVGVAVAAIIVALILGSIIVTLVQSARIARERDKAARERDKAQRVSAFLTDIFKVSDYQQAGNTTLTARDLLDKGAERVERELNDQPEVQATLMNTIGNAYVNLGLLDRGMPLLEKAFKIQQQTMGPENTDVAQSLSDLCWAYYQKGDYNRAEPLCRQGLAMRRKLLGNENADVAWTLANLSSVLHDKGDLAAAEPLSREALAMRRKVLGDSHPYVGTSLNNLARLLFDKGDYEAAEPLYREAVTIGRKAFGNEHQLLAIRLNNLALVLEARGDLAAAEPMLREALAMQRKLLGEEHPLVALFTHNLGRLQYDKGDSVAAEALYREAIAMAHKLIGDEHPRMARYQTSLAVLLTDKADYATAEPMLRHALEVERKKLNQRHADTAATLVALGRLLTERGSAQEAESLLREALQMRQEILIKGNWQIAEVQSVLGGCLTALQRYDEAESLLREGYNNLKAKRGGSDVRTRQALARLTKSQDAKTPGQVGAKN